MCLCRPEVKTPWCGRPGCTVDSARGPLRAALLDLQRHIKGALLALDRIDAVTKGSAAGAAQV